MPLSTKGLALYSRAVGLHIPNCRRSKLKSVEEFGAVLAGNEPTRSIIPLDWDQTHSLNGSVFGNYKKWSANAVFQYGTGYPYTPMINNYESQGEVLSNVLLRNSRRKPTTFRIDLRLQREILEK